MEVALFLDKESEKFLGFKRISEAYEKACIFFGELMFYISDPRGSIEISRLCLVSAGGGAIRGLENSLVHFKKAKKLQSRMEFLGIEEGIVLLIVEAFNDNERIYCRAEFSFCPEDEVSGCMVSLAATTK